jgi:DNA repair exonuclease SbcCD ATPase subunit
MNIESIRNRVSAKFGNIQEVSAGVMRSVRRQGESAMAVYLFDLNNRVTESAAHLESYLDDVLGSSYFDEAAPADLRWNHYLYLVADKQSGSGEAFEAAKRKVEADKSYARKFVLTEDELDGAIARIDSVAEVHDQGKTADVVETWTAKLVAAGLESVLDPKRTIADVVRVAASRPVKDTTRARRTSGASMSELLASAPLSSVDLTAFRQYPSRKKFDNLGRANLIVGVNGVGKTSFLEGIEYLYCGGNRRSASSETQRVQGRLSSGAEVFTASSQSLSDFKTRQRHWYGNDDDTRRNLLPNQFGRFNFLNTDAAAELTLLDRDKDNPAVRGNFDSLAALLSGDEAMLLWRRIQAVSRAVADEKRRLESDRHAKQADRREADAERKTLEGAPQKSDAAFAVLAKDLEAIGWTKRPKDKKEFNRDLVERVSELASKLGVSQQVTWTAEPVTPAWLTKEARDLRESSAVLRSQVLKVTEAQQRAGGLTLQKDELEKRLTALESIPRDDAQDLIRRVGELTRIQRDLAEVTRTLSSVASGQTLDVDPSVSSMTLSLALTSTKAQLEEARTVATSNQRSLAALRKSQSALDGLASELRELVHNVFAHGHSEQDCPVCGSHFEGEELKARIDALALGARGVGLTEAELATSSARTHVETLAETMARLERIQQFCAASNVDGTSIRVSDARDAIDKQQLARHGLMERREAVEQSIEEYRRNGLTIDHLRALCVDDSASGAKGQQELDTAGATLRVRSAVASVNEQLSTSSDELATALAKCEKALASVGLSDSSPLPKALEQVRTRLDAVDAALDACKWTRAVVSLTDSTDLQHLLTVTRSAVMGATALAAAIDTENQSGDRLTKVKDRLQRLESALTTLRESIGRLTEAAIVLEAIVEKHSLESAIQAAVAATHGVADEIFARIHMPAEYRIATKGDLPLVRRDNGQAKELSQVSTGQRAAYALSMFLAMNSQVRDGPRVLILDDPISHIDDLNALSFLDYLRNLVLHSQRQVFFATADEKIAGLFSHKFAFLGKEFRTIELSR